MAAIAGTNEKYGIPTEQRIDILDSIRGGALLGILVVTINFFGRPNEYFLNISYNNEYSGINYYIWAIVVIFFSGAMRGLFSVLFGTSTILLLFRLEKRNSIISPPDIYYRRLIILMIFGMVDAYIFLWNNDILYAYAICGLFLFPFRNAKPKLLIALGIFLLLIPGLKSTYTLYKLRELRQNGEVAVQLTREGKQLTAQQAENRQKWEAYQAASNKSTLKAKALQRLNETEKGYFSIAKNNIETVVWAQSEYFYREEFLDIFPFLLIGMALLKLKILTGERSKKFYWGMALIGYAVGTTIGLLQLHTYLKTDFDETQYINYLPFDLFQEKRLFMTAGHLGLLMLLYKYHLADWFMKLMAKVGQMTLTNYMMQAIIGAVIFYGFGFGLYGKLERYELYYVVLAIWIFQIIFSNVWMKYFKYGPVEWIWRSLTYLKIQPIVRKRLNA
ncbi:MAG TPA: DUF418 domain-containing protein [Chitinophagaceae bacterium]|nr:DUF418 domain-containing protein [Chitinophagaceae bacterium]